MPTLPVILHSSHAAAENLDLRSLEGFSLTRCKSESRNRSNAGQSLSAKPKRADCRQIVLGSDFARRVSLETQQCILPIHAVPIIHNPDQGASPTLHMHLHVRGASIETVFHQFADDCRRSLHHLTCRNLTGQRVWKDSDLGHLKMTKAGDGHRSH